MEIKGKLIKIGETAVFGDKGFKKREFVLETVEQYPQKIQFEAVQDKCGLLDTLLVGQIVSVSFGVRGREWTNPEGEVKYFNSLQAWRVVPDSDVQQPPQQQTQQPANTGNGDVPF